MALALGIAQALVALTDGVSGGHIVALTAGPALPQECY